MKQGRVVRRRRLHEFHPAAPNPTETLDEQQHTEHDNKPHVKLVAEDSHGETCLCYSIPRLLVEVFDLGSPERAVEDELEGMAKEDREEE